MSVATVAAVLLHRRRSVAVPGRDYTASPRRSSCPVLAALPFAYGEGDLGLSRARPPSPLPASAHRPRVRLPPPSPAPADEPCVPPKPTGTRPLWLIRRAHLLPGSFIDLLDVLCSPDGGEMQQKWELAEIVCADGDGLLVRRLPCSFQCNIDILCVFDRACGRAGAFPPAPPLCFWRALGILCCLPRARALSPLLVPSPEGPVVRCHRDPLLSI